MIVYGVCTSCAYRITIATVQKVPQRSIYDEGSLSKISCKRCGVSNTFSGAELKIKPTTLIKGTVIIMFSIGFGIALVFYWFTISLGIKLLLAVGYLVLGGGYLYKVLKVNSAVHDFNYNSR